MLLLVITGCSQGPLTPGPTGPQMPGPGGPGGSGAALKFAVVGDARPGNPNDTANYPAAIVAGNFKLIQDKGAQFAVGTGDYMFASNDTAVQGQVDQLVAGEANFTGPIYHALGNHECTGATASNCPNGNETPNIRAFMSRLVPSGTTTPYYRVDVDTPSGKAKFVFVAANAWSDAQASWLTTQLADPTTYTFIVRHEPASITETPGVSPSEAIIKQFPMTLELLGHSHEYRRLDKQHVISGNGGAPIHSYFGNSASNNYGFLLFEQQPDGTLSATEIDESTGNPTDSWTISANGT